MAPAGGIDCQPAVPVLVDPVEGSTTADTTPTFTGTAEPGAEVELFVDGDSIGTTTAEDDGGFSFTPTAPLPTGPHTATAVQTTDGGTSAPSNGNDFTITADQPAAPVITSPTNGSTTTNPNVPISGTAPPGSQVIIVIDGTEAGSTIADGSGTFSFTPLSPLSAGKHEIVAVAVDGDGNRSQPSDPVSVTVVAAATNGSQPLGRGAAGTLASTGGPTGWLTLGAILSLMGGAAALTGARRRKRA